MTDQPTPDFTSPIAGRIEVRDPCPWCGDRQMIPRSQMDEHCARLHPDVKTAVSSAGVVQLPPTNQTALRDRIAEALYPTYGQQDRNRSLAIADAVLAVLPAPVDRAVEADRDWWKMQAHAVQARADVENRADVLREARTIASRLAAHAVGFQDVLDDTDRGPWGKTVGADIKALLAALDGEQPLSPFYEHPECGFRWHGRDGMDIPMRDGQPVCPRCELRRMAAEAPATEEQDASQADTFPAWLAQRFDPQGAPWDGMSDDDRSYWEHHARAVRRAVERNGFREPAAQPHNDETPDFDPIETSTEAALGQAEERLRQVLAVAEVIEANGIGWAADSVRRAAKGELS